MSVWTVVGVWVEGEPVPLYALAGRADLLPVTAGPRPGRGFVGGWAAVVSADNAALAAADAMGVMLHTGEGGPDEGGESCTPTKT